MNILLEKARRMLEENIIPFWQGLDRKSVV